MAAVWILRKGGRDAQCCQRGTSCGSRSGLSSSERRLRAPREPAFRHARGSTGASQRPRRGRRRRRAPGKEAARGLWGSPRPPRGTARAAPAGPEAAAGTRATPASSPLGSSLSAWPGCRWAHVTEMKLRVGSDPRPERAGATGALRAISEAIAPRLQCRSSRTVPQLCLVPLEDQTDPLSPYTMVTAGTCCYASCQH